MGTNLTILDDGALQNMTYDEIHENLMAYEQNHINRYHKDEKKKLIAFNAETITKEEEEVDEANNEGWY